MQWLASQVEVEPPKEHTVNNPDYEREPDKWPESLTTTENIFIMYFFDRLSQQEIAEKLFITQQYISKVVKKHKELLIKNLRKTGCNRL